jgi:signal transduction histidine kinase
MAAVNATQGLRIVIEDNGGGFEQVPENAWRTGSAICSSA